MLVASIAGYHVVDHHRIPERWHTALHALVAGAVVEAGRRLGLSWEELGLHRRHLRPGTATGARHATLPVLGLLGASTLPWVEELLEDPRASSLTNAELRRRVLLDIPIGTALYEEIVFRGVLLACSAATPMTGRRWPGRRSCSGCGTSCRRSTTAGTTRWSRPGRPR